MPGACTAAGRPVWFGGGKLAPDLTLPKLRARWPGPGPGPAARLHGHGMTDGAARAALRREVAAAAAGARSEPEFFAGLEAAGLLVRLRRDPARPGGPAGYAVSLPGLIHHRDGRQAWYGGRTLAPGLGLGALRARWRAGRPGTPASRAAFAGAEAGDIFGYAAGMAASAAEALQGSCGPAQASDIAWAAADLLTAAVTAAPSPQLQRGADGFGRAARAPWGRIPAPSPVGAGLRTAAYLLARCEPARSRRILTRTALIGALSRLTEAVAELRINQQRLPQAAAARRASADLAAAAAARPGVAEAVARLASADFPGPPAAARPAAARASRTRGTRRSPGPRRHTSPGEPDDTPGQGVP
jgi:hypothetical protein